MQGVSSCAVVALGGVAFASPAVSAAVSISVNKTIQRMTVSVDRLERRSWPVSTGTADYVTPAGAFAPSEAALWQGPSRPHAKFYATSVGWV
jgi:hypothetical protein